MIHFGPARDRTHRRSWVYFPDVTIDQSRFSGPQPNPTRPRPTVAQRRRLGGSGHASGGRGRRHDQINVRPGFRTKPAGQPFRRIQQREAAAASTPNRNSARVRETASSSDVAGHRSAAAGGERQCSAGAGALPPRHGGSVPDAKPGLQIRTSARLRHGCAA
jgi:hypothetical protein